MITELQRSTATEIIGCASEGEASCRCLHSDGVRTRQHRGASTGGTSLLEFALVAPMVFILLFAVFDFARLFYVEMNLQNAVREAGRFGVTGSHLSDPNHPGQNLSRVNSIIQVAQQAAMGLDVSNIQISSTGGDRQRGRPRRHPNSLPDHQPETYDTHRCPVLQERYLYVYGRRQLQERAFPARQHQLAEVNQDGSIRPR